MITTFCGSIIAADVAIGSSNELSSAMIIFATFIEGSRGRFMKVWVRMCLKLFMRKHKLWILLLVAMIWTLSTSTFLQSFPRLPPETPTALQPHPPSSFPPSIVLSFPTPPPFSLPPNFPYPSPTSFEFYSTFVKPCSNLQSCLLSTSKFIGLLSFLNFAFLLYRRSVSFPSVSWGCGLDLLLRSGECLIVWMARLKVEEGCWILLIFCWLKGGRGRLGSEAVSVPLPQAPDEPTNHQSTLPIAFSFFSSPDPPRPAHLQSPSHSLPHYSPTWPGTPTAFSSRTPPSDSTSHSTPTQYQVTYEVFGWVLWWIGTSVSLSLWCHRLGLTLPGERKDWSRIFPRFLCAIGSGWWKGGGGSQTMRSGEVGRIITLRGVCYGNFVRVFWVFISRGKIRIKQKQILCSFIVTTQNDTINTINRKDLFIILIESS